MIVWVRTNTSSDYTFEAKRFDIHDGIIHFYDDDGEITWVIKDWISFRCEHDPKDPISPDEFYENLKEEPPK